MARPLTSKAIRLKLEAAALSAWAAQKIHAGQPGTVDTTLPVAVVHTLGADNVFQNTLKVRWAYTFQIVGRFAYPALATDLVENEKEDRANELYEAVMDTVWAGTCFLPKVERVEYLEPEGLGERAYEVAVTFTCQQEGDRT